CIKIPKADQPGEAHTFNFYMSNVGKDNPQGSFDCVQQKESSSEALQLSCLGVIQNKITVCATSDSYLTTRACMTQAEEESRNRSANVVKPGGPFLGRKVQVKRPPQSIPDVAPVRKRSTPMNPANIVRRIHMHNPVSQRSYRDRIVHLLALRNYKKPELLARLHRDGVSQKDKNSFGIILHQVASLNPKDNSYSLKDSVFKDIQKDWPGYSEIDKQSLELILSRKLNASQNATSTSSQPPETSNKDAPSTSQKQLLSVSYMNLLNKKQRISRLTSRVQCTPEGQGTQDLPADRVSQTSSSISEDQQQQDTSQTPLGIPTPAAVPVEPPTPADKKPVLKATKQKHSEIEPTDTTSANEGEKDLGDEETAKQRNCHLDSGVQEASSASEDDASSPREQPDYFLKYVAVTSHEQRESYKNDFNAEYDEYRALHAQVESVLNRFMKFSEQRKLLSPGSKERQELHEEIIAEYQKISESSPSYHEVKRRCEYLHKKLSHIKGLVEQFDEKQGESWH
ncbi:PREDICTED: RNA polymerase II elongation factor ELL2, partial [Buceros rhinoceros silvestris]|uniref:RNA polymerase II elongation factor ELL2 n=1 Tax=Buceros rhinoceros silvestris TaxID=175836 RepID=UPI000528E6D5